MVDRKGERRLLGPGAVARGYMQTQSRATVAFLQQSRAWGVLGDGTETAAVYIHRQVTLGWLVDTGCSSRGPRFQSQHP